MSSGYSNHPIAGLSLFSAKMRLVDGLNLSGFSLRYLLSLSVGMQWNAPSRLYW